MITELNSSIYKINLRPIPDLNPCNFLNENNSTTLKLFFTISHLQQIHRKGWLIRGMSVEKVESVAEHSFDMAMLSIILKLPERVTIMCLIHELGEIKVGDITPKEPTCQPCAKK